MRTEQTKLGKLMQHWPYLSNRHEPQMCVGSEYTANDIWSDLTRITLGDGGILVIGLYPRGTHTATKPNGEEVKGHERDPRYHIIREQLLKHGDVDLSRVVYPQIAPTTRKITVQAREGYRGGEENIATGEITWYDVPARPAGIETKTFEKRFHLGNRRNLQILITAVNERATVKSILKSYSDDAEVGGCPITALLIMEPNIDEGDLTYLQDFRAACPGVDVYIFHRWNEKKYGVQCEGGTTGSLWDIKSAFDEEVDLPWVIEGIAHAGESTWFGALPKQMKTWVMLCVAKALLTGEPLFGDERFRVPNKSNKVIYLIPEASRASVKKRLKVLGLMGFLYDPITNPEGSLFVRTLSAGEKIKLYDPRLLEMVNGSDVFLDTAIRWLEGEENKSSDVAVLSENIFSLIAAGARSVWCAHHAPKGFADASSMTLENMFRGSGEYGAALSNAYGLCQTDEKTSTLHFHAIVGRDLDELIPDMTLQGRPYLSTIGNFKIVDNNAEPFSGRGSSKSGPKDPEREAKIAYAHSLNDGTRSHQQIADEVNKKFDTDHDKSTVTKWLKKPRQSTMFRGDAAGSDAFVAPLHSNANEGDTV